MSELLTEILTPEEIQESFNEMESQLSTALSREAELMVKNRRYIELLHRIGQECADCVELVNARTGETVRRAIPTIFNALAQEALSTPTPPGLGAKMLEMVRAGLEGAQYMVEAGLDGTDFFRKDHPIKLIIDTAEAFTPEDLKALGVE